MALTSLFALIDDIATLLDDIAVMSKVAAKKTAGVLGDDLALNAQQVAGVAAKRELPVVFAVATGSFKNKLILVPCALLISAFAPQVVTPTDRHLLFVPPARFLQPGRGSVKANSKPDMGPVLEPKELVSIPIFWSILTNRLLSGALSSRLNLRCCPCLKPPPASKLIGISFLRTYGGEGCIAAAR